MASTAWLYEALAQFYLRTQGQWCASGKTLLRAVKKYNYDLASAYRDAFDETFKRGHTQELEALVKQILEPYGGLLRDGYVQNAPVEWRKK